MRMDRTSDFPAAALVIVETQEMRPIFSRDLALFGQTPAVDSERENLITPAMEKEASFRSDPTFRHEVVDTRRNLGGRDRPIFRRNRFRRDDFAIGGADDMKLPPDVLVAADRMGSGFQGNGIVHSLRFEKLGHADHDLNLSFGA